jgi:hypothetical protein
MQDLKNLDQTTLLDMLADYTMKVSRFIADKSFDENYDNCKTMVQSLTEEIKLRKNSNANISANPDANLI